MFPILSRRYQIIFLIYFGCNDYSTVSNHQYLSSLGASNAFDFHATFADEVSWGPAADRQSLVNIRIAWWDNHKKFELSSKRQVPFTFADRNGPFTLFLFWQDFYLWVALVYVLHSESCCWWIAHSDGSVVRIRNESAMQVVYPTFLLFNCVHNNVIVIACAKSVLTFLQCWC